MFLCFHSFSVSYFKEHQYPWEVGGLHEWMRGQLQTIQSLMLEIYNKEKEDDLARSWLSYNVLWLKTPKNHHVNWKKKKKVSCSVKNYGTWLRIHLGKTNHNYIPMILEAPGKISHLMLPQRDILKGQTNLLHPFLSKSQCKWVNENFQYKNVAKNLC